MIKPQTSLFKNIIHLKEVDSTNTFLKTNSNKLQNNSIAFSLNQTNGRGTKGRKFISLKNKTLAISFLLKNINLPDLKKFPIVSSVACFKALNNLKIENVKIKWLNDILINNKKIAGILCESLISNNLADLIIGIGINILGSEKDFENLNLKFAGSIYSETGKIFKIKTIVHELIKTFEDILQNMKKHKNYFDRTILQEYENNCGTIGKFVRILKNETPLNVLKATKISSEGCLICKNEKETIQIDSSIFSIETIS